MTFNAQENFKFIDIHSHLLPNVDDGSKSFEQSVSLITELSNIGVTDIILTPHYSLRKRFTVPKEKICDEYTSFINRCKNQTNVNIYLGREVEISHDIPNLLKENKLLTLADSDYVLIEFSPSVSFREIVSAIREVTASGYKPIIAHIERYICVEENLDRLNDLKDMGASIQMNLTSFASSNRRLKKLCKKLIKLGIPDYMGTDTHCKVLPVRDAEKIIKKIKKMTGNEYAYNLFYGNAHKIIKGD